MTLDADINPLNAELNPICHLLALLGGATIVVVSRLRVKERCVGLCQFGQGFLSHPCQASIDIYITDVWHVKPCSLVNRLQRLKLCHPHCVESKYNV